MHLHSTPQRNAVQIWQESATSPEVSKRGKCADMIVTAQNPLEDLRVLRHVDMVIANGTVINHPQIKKRSQVEAELDKFIQD